MTNKQIDAYGKKRGCTVDKIKKKADKIRTIQIAEGNADCFGAPWSAQCGQTDCLWHDDCIVTE